MSPDYQRTSVSGSHIIVSEAATPSEISKSKFQTTERYALGLTDVQTVPRAGSLLERR
jgi:hypothetical protein